VFSTFPPIRQNLHCLLSVTFLFKPFLLDTVHKYTFSTGTSNIYNALLGRSGVYNGWFTIRINLSSSQDEDYNQSITMASPTTPFPLCPLKISAKFLNE
jgi:hypothetical protein